MIPIYVRTSSTGIDLIWPGAWDLSSSDTLVCIYAASQICTYNSPLIIGSLYVRPHTNHTHVRSIVNPYAFHFPSYHTSWHPSPRTRLSYPLVGIWSISKLLGTNYWLPGLASASSQSLSTCEYVWNYISHSSEFAYRGIFGTIYQMLAALRIYTLLNAMPYLRISLIEGLIVCIYIGTLSYEDISSYSLSYSAAFFPPQTFLVRPLRVNLHL